MSSHKHQTAPPLSWLLGCQVLPQVEVTIPHFIQSRAKKNMKSPHLDDAPYTFFYFAVNLSSIKNIKKKNFFQQHKLKKTDNMNLNEMFWN